MMYLIQCSARTEAFENSLHKIDPKKKITTIAKEDLCSLLKDPNPYLSQSPNSTHESQIEEDSTSEEKYDGLLMENDPLIEKKKNTIMINVEKNHDMCNLYLGKIGRNAYFINLVVFLLLTVMSYSAVFGSSLSTLFPIKSITKGDSCIIDEKFTSNCQHNYLVYVCIYACIVVPFSCLDLPEQKIIQILLCLFRFLSIGAIIVTTLVGIYRPNSQQDNNDPPHIAPGSKLFKLNGLYLIFTASIFVQVIHHSVTIISEGIPDKSKLRFSFTSSLTTTLLLYTLVGTVCSLYFGKNTKTVITLNWLDYTANYKNTPVWASIIKYIIILFPMLDLISIFPLKIVTLGTGMQSFFYPQTIGKTDLKSKLIKIAFRLVSSLPPIIGSMFVKKLPLIIFFIGITGCFIGFIFPSLLQYKSGKLNSIGRYRSVRPSGYEPDTLPLRHNAIYTKKLNIVL
ncbi:hypothetical protein M0813_23542 [Anaeramoeba flamelloides]|uniref:Amino acid transporter transmembrane domain-containing protein n=1 Tax=Anaeramoeba flamelloides TaxID=1746091 RepID=A0ABQ8YAW7_9EUKA|nr:hypothetical protein M0813_23542 [Anaeramoeba flamelloides]